MTIQTAIEKWKTVLDENNKAITRTSKRGLFESTAAFANDNRIVQGFIKDLEAIKLTEQPKLPVADSAPDCHEND